MARKVIDCGQALEGTGCTLTIAGEEREVFEVAVAHAVARHGLTDMPALRERLHGLLEAAGASPDPPGAASAQAGMAEEVVDRFNAAWDRHDLDAALEMISDDCEFDATSPPPDGKRVTGKAAIRAAWKPIFDDPASHFTAEDSFAAGPRVAVRWRYDWSGGHVRGVDVYTVLDGKVTKKLAYVKG